LKSRQLLKNLVYLLTKEMLKTSSLLLRESEDISQRTTKIIHAKVRKSACNDDDDDDLTILCSYEMFFFCGFDNVVNRFDGHYSIFYN